jgi:hypothetical protein
MGGVSGTGFGGSASQATQGGQQGGFGGQQGGFGGQQGGFGGQQGGYGGFGGQQRFNPTPQFQNPYGPTIYNPYSPADQRQFGFQTPFQPRQQQTQQPQENIGIGDFMQRQFGPNVAEEFNPETYQRNPNMQKPYMPQRQMTPEQQRMQDVMSIHSQGYYQQQQPRGMTMDMPQRYGRQPSPPPNPYQMYGGLGGLFNRQNAYPQQPQQNLQAQINAANQQFLQRGREISSPAPSTTGVTNSQQPAQQQQPYYSPVDFGSAG